jgi:hypothetical protein
VGVGAGRLLLTKRIVALVVTLGLLAPLAAATPAMASMTLGLSNASFQFNVAARQKGSGETIIYNDGTEPIKVMVYAANQVVDDKGATQFLTPSRDTANLLKSPASWIRIQLPASTKAIGNTPYLEMTPGQRVNVKFDFEVPPGVAPGDHQVLIFFEMFSFPGEVQKTGSTISGRIGARIRLRVQGQIRQDLQVRPFVLRELVIGDKAPYSFVLRNVGNVDVPLTGTVTLFDGNDAEVLKSDVVTETTVYADTMAERSGVLDVSSVVPGRYRAEFRIDYQKESADGQGSAEKIVLTRTVWVIPLWLAILAVVIVGGAVLWLSWRGAVKAGERRALARVPGDPPGASAPGAGRRKRWWPWHQHARKSGD